MRLACTLSFALLSLVTLGCDGHIWGSSNSVTPDHALPGDGPVSGPNGASDPSAMLPGPTDDELRAKDPQLFEVALKYFPGQAPVAAKKRLFRLTRQQLDATAAALLPQAQGQGQGPRPRPSALATLPRDPLQTNYEYAENLGFGAATFTPLTDFVDQLSEQVLANPHSVVDCSAQQDSAACLESSARDFVERAFRGIVSPATLERFAKLYSGSAREVGVAQATADLVNVTLTSPGFLFREEVQTAADGVLLPAQLLQNLSYTLADAPPQAVGLVLASGQQTLAASDIAQAAAQVLETAAARDKLLRFFLAWLEVKEPQDFDLAPSVFPEFTPEVAAAVVDDTRRFLTAQLGNSAPALHDLTEATTAFVSGPSAFLYGLDQAPSDGKTTPDASQRLGIFSQPAVIASHSGPTTTRLVKRGVFFTRKVMCLPLGMPPPDVNTTIPAEVTGTERQRIESVTTPARCAGCHAFINPFGFMQENYDAMGRYRTTDAAQAIDASVSVNFLDEGPFSAATATDALRGFTRSLRFQQCFTRQLFRFYTGREETAGDDPLLRQIFFELAQNPSHSIMSMLKALVSAPLYHSRSEAP